MTKEKIGLGVEWSNEADFDEIEFEFGLERISWNLVNQKSANGAKVRQAEAKAKAKARKPTNTPGKSLMKMTPGLRLHAMERRRIGGGWRGCGVERREDGGIWRR